MKKISRILILPLLMMGVIFITNNSCKKDEASGPVPVLTTAAITNVAYSTANCGGTITSDGGLAVTSRGVCWSIGQTPKITDAKTIDGAGGGSFTSNIKGLSANTTYFVRAYALNKNGAGYGMALSFTTKQALIPILTTDTVGNITQTTASCGGTITLDYGSAVTARGVCWSTNPTPTITDSKSTDGTGTGIFTSNITGLIANTTYYVKAYATNSSGTGYGNSRTFKTKQDFTTLAIINTTAVTNITKTTASSGGTITSSGGTSILSSGVCWSTVQTPTITDSKTSDGTSVGSFTSNITGLIAYTTYYVRAYATNYAGTAYGNAVSFITQSPTIPVLTTNSISNITLTTAYGGGSIVSDGAATITAKGLCYSTAPNPSTSNSKTIDGSGPNNFTSNLIGLTINTTYYVKSYATNSVGTAYGNEVSFTTQSGIITLTTTAASTIKTTTAITGGYISSDGGASVTDRGVCYSTSPNPTTTDNKTNDGSGLGSFTSNLTGLTLNTLYYVKSYAINSVGTSYGNEVSFTTQSGIITITTTAVSSITTYSAASGGNIINDGGSTITSRGVCWSTSSGPTTSLSTKTTNGTGTGSFTSSLIGLTTGNTYYVRAYAINSLGTAYGSEVSFIIPTLTIGDSYQGGVIAYLLVSGDPGYSSSVLHGIIATSSDQSTGIYWDNGSNTTTGATGKVLGTGNANTNTIFTNLGAGNYAAKLCYDLVLNGYSDWYLPSQDELYKLYLNKSAIGGFANKPYWSSSEEANWLSWVQDFTTGAQPTYSKGNNLNVRAIRSF